MTKAIRFTCPSCETRYRVPEALAGRKARCKDCGAAFAIPPSARLLLANAGIAKTPVAAAVGATVGAAAARPALPGGDAAPAPPSGPTSSSDPWAAAGALDAPVAASGSTSDNAGDTAAANGAAKPQPARGPSAKDALVNAGKQAAAPSKAKVGPWNVFALAGGVLMLAAIAVPWIDPSVPASGLLGWPSDGVSPLRVLTDGAVLDDLGVVPPAGGMPMTVRLAFVLLPILGVLALHGAWRGRRHEAQPVTTYAAVAAGSIAAVVLAALLAAGHTWDVASDDTFAAAIAAGMDAGSQGSIRDAVPAIRAHMGPGVLAWLVGTISMLIAVLVARR